MARSAKPQTTRDQLKLIMVQIRKNEQEHKVLIEKQKELQAQQDLHDFNLLQAVLQERGMTICDVLNQYTENSDI